MTMTLMGREYNQFLGITEETWYEETPGDAPNKIHLKRYQDVEHILARNQELYNSHSDKPTFHDVEGGAFKAASIPAIVIEKWKREGFDWYNSTTAEKRAKLNDPDFKKLRTRPGKL
jgi:hypothetical protein